MVHANNWFDEWQQACYKTPDALTDETYAKLFGKCEEWARKKKLESDTKNKDAMDIGNVGGSEEQYQQEWESDVKGWVDDNGIFWSEDYTWYHDVNETSYADETYEEAANVDAVGKAKGKGKGGFKSNKTPQRTAERTSGE